MSFNEPSEEDWAADDFPPARPRRLWVRIVGFITLAAFVTVFGLQTWATFARNEASEDAVEGGGPVDERPAEEVPLPDTLTDPVKTASCFGLDMEPEDAADGVDARLAWEDIAPIADAVERLRDLQFEERVPAKVISTREMDKRIARTYERQYGAEQAQRDSRALAILGLVEEDTDIGEVLSDAVEGRILGFYLPGKDRLVVRSTRGELSPLEEETLAHELEHALVDQSFELPGRWPKDPIKADEVLALRSLVEGDATVTEARYLYLALSGVERAGAIDDSSAALAGLGAAPHFLERGLSFPYIEGAAFVCELYLSGGWEAVNDAYDDPPKTTAEVLFPELYLQGFEPRSPSPLGDLPESWTAHPHSSFGASDLLFLLEAPGGRRSDQIEAALNATEAWAGGEMRTWSKADQTALGFGIATRGDNRSLCKAITDWYEVTFDDDRSPATRSGVTMVRGPKQSAVISCTPLDIRVGIGPMSGSPRWWRVRDECGIAGEYFHRTCR